MNNFLFKIKSSIIFFLLLTLILSKDQNKYKLNEIFEKDGYYFDNNNKIVKGKIYTIINGKSFLNGLIVKGKKHGKWRTWFKGGQILEENFNYGILDGTMSLIYKNGQKKWRYTYKYGIKDGLTTYWYSNGKKLKEGSYRNGDPSGIWYFWDDNGQLIEKKNYKRKEKLFNKKLKTYILKEDVIN